MPPKYLGVLSLSPPGRPWNSRRLDRASSQIGSCRVESYLDQDGDAGGVGQRQSALRGCQGSQGHTVQVGVLAQLPSDDYGPQGVNEEFLALLLGHYTKGRTTGPRPTDLRSRLERLGERVDTLSA
jgi:hypothetical protein